MPKEQSGLPNLSKSKFVAGCQCLKRLWWQVYERELAGETDEIQEAMFEQGREVGKFATKAFPGGVLVREDHLNHEKAVARTKELTADKTVPAIFEAAFTHENIPIRVDIFQRLPRNRWRLIEVKQSTKVKDYHIIDVAIQKYVLEELGLKLDGVCLMHLNSDYVYDGIEYDLEELFTIEELDREIQGVEVEIPEQLKIQRSVLISDETPNIEPGKHCSKPFVCEFYDQCNDPFPLDHISNIPRLGEKKQKALEMRGVESIKDIPDNFDLTETQRRAWISVKENRIVVEDGLGDELADLQYPLFFMDFETISPAIPRFKNMRPYGYIPFQWSVHVQQSPGAQMEHYKFLADDAYDPREAFLTQLLDVLEKEDGHIIVYNKTFEDLRLKDLSNWFPQYANRIEEVQERIWDLLSVMRRYVYHPAFGGSFSLKGVLPALIPDMSYKDMTVAGGEEAGLAFERMIHGDLSEEERVELREALLDYCKQDTLAMVRLLSVLDDKSR